MGKIVKESARSTTISYIGVVISFISAVLIMPKLLAPDEIGVLRVILAISGTFAGLFSLGISQLVFRTYKTYRDQNPSGYSSMILLVSFAGCLLSIPFFLYYDLGIGKFDGAISDIIGTALLSILVYVMIVSRIFYISFEALVRMTKSITFMAVMQNLYLKGMPIIFLGLYYFDLINFDGFLVLYIVLFIIAPLILVVYLRRKEDLKFGSLPTYTREEKRHLFSLGGFGLLNTIAAALLLYIDTLMVNEYLKEALAGVYTTMYLFGSVVAVPSRSLKLISGVFIVEALKDGDTKKVEEINQKSSQSLLVVSGLIFALVWGNIGSITGYLDEAYSIGIYVVLFIGLAQLFDVFAGMSSEIISASKYYWLHTPITMVTITVAIIANIYFIPEMGVTGAAIATFISFGVLHLSRMISVMILFKISPFNTKILLGTIFATLVIVGTSYLPSVGNIYIQLIYKTALIGTTYGLLMYIFRISPDVNNLAQKFIPFLKRKG
ncbi:MAG: polysaccharide biosynthesis C-terminal domain-containing protein [Crocinitomicaceae bacterium]